MALLSRALQLEPHNPDAMEDAALVSLLDGHDAEALRYAQQLLQRRPRNERAVLVSAIAELNLGHAGAASAICSTPAGKAQAASDPLLRAVQRAATQTRSGKDAADATAVAAPAPEPQEIFFAAQTFRAPELRRTVEGWLESLTGSQDAAVQAHAWSLLGDEQDGLGDAATAEQAYRHALQITPCDVNAILSEAQLQIAQSRRDEADKLLYRLRECPPTSRVVALREADLLMSLRMFVDARDALKQVNDAGQGALATWYRQGLCDFRLQQTDNAEADFRHALDLAPEDVESRIGLGVVLLSTSRKGEAKREFDSLLARGVRPPNLLYYEAQLAREAGETATAESLLLEVVHAAPQDARPYTALGQLYLQMDKLPEAERALQKAISLDASAAAAHFYMATLLRKQKRPAEARLQQDEFARLHREEKQRGIVGLRISDEWNYPGFLPADAETENNTN